jgi:hypothetical protein
MQPNTISPLSPETENYAPLTEYQQGQLLHIHLEGDFKYTTDAGIKVAPTAWRRMLCALIDGGYIVLRGGPQLTAHGRAWLDMHHLEIKTLA